jgi:glycosyltransferase involved in cell wall biosynthesis
MHNVNHQQFRIGVIGLRGFPRVMGGVERHCEHLYPRLGALGFSVYVCRRRNYLNQESLEQCYKGIRFIDIYALRNKHLEALLHSLLCIVILRFFNVKIVHIHSFGPGLVAPIARLLGFKVVLTYHLPNYLQGKWSSFDRMLLRFAEFIACKFANEIIAVSKTNQAFIKQNTGKGSHYIPNGVHIPSGPYLNVEKYGLKKGEYIFTACRFVPEKGIDLLIKAFLKLKTNWKLAIAGGADHKSEYSREILSLTKTRVDIIFTGIVTGLELESLFDAAGIFVLPSFIEGQPISLLEAMSHGVPCLISDIEAHKELGLDESCYFRAGDIADLAKNLESRIHDGNFLESGRKHRELVFRKFNWDTIARSTSDVYKTMLDR